MATVATSREGPSGLTLLAFAGIVLIAGANLVAVRFTTPEIPPLFGAGLRFGVAGVALLMVAGVMRVPLPRGRELLGTLLYGLFAFTGAMAFGYLALRDLPAGVGGLIIATVPVITLFLAWLQHQEPFRVRSLFGALLTVVGIIVLLAGSGAGTFPIGSGLLMVIGAVCLAEAGIVVKRFPPSHPMISNGLAMSSGAVILLLLSPLAGEQWALPDEAAVWWALIFMVIVGSVGLFALYLFVLKGWTASGASYQFVLMPFVAAFLASWLLDEGISGGFVIGGLIVLAGVYVGALSSGSLPLPGTHHQEALAQRCSTT